MSNGIDSLINIRFGDAHGGFDAENIAETTAFTRQHSPILNTLEDIGHSGCRHFGAAFLQQLNSDHETLTPNVADQGGVDACKLLQEISSNLFGILLQFFFFNYLKF